MANLDIQIKRKQGGTVDILNPKTTASNVSISSGGNIPSTATDMQKLAESLGSTAFTSLSNATTESDGLMSSTDKTKLDGVAAGANNYSHPTTSGNKHIPSGGSTGQILRWSSDGTAVWGSDNNTWTAMVGATSSANGSVGYVNAVPPKDGYNTKYLRADGTWQVPPDNNTTYSDATQSASGLMSAADKTKLDGAVTGVNVGTTSYSPSSGVVSLPAYPTTLPASDVSSWAKASSKPTYTASEIGAIATTAKGAASGVAELDANGKVPASQLPSYVDDVLEYSAKSSFPSTGETGKIYVDTFTNKTYRWSGSAYVEISASLALGETSSTAYYGDKGKTAYSHATETRLTTATASGLYKVASTAQGHIASLTSVAKADITALGIPAQDTTYSVVSTSANGLAPKVTDTSKFLKGDGTWATPANTWTAMVGATSSANGSVGYVNATPPKDGYNTKYLRADGSWQVPPNTTYSAATQSANGLMSSTDKTKLDGIATGANNYTHPTTSGNKHIPSGGSSGQILRWSADGTATWGSDNNTWTAMVGATSSANGSVGYVNAVPPKDGYNTKYLRADGSWQVPPNTTYSDATTSASGLMSATDKTKLNGIATGATAVSESTVSGWGFTKNTGTYSKPSTGIPKTDLASAVQTSLGKADSALQSHQTIKQDGITGATVNRFGTCGTAAGTAAKTVSITSGTFNLEAGARVTVKFSNANTASTPTLNVNSKGAKNIYSKGSQITTGSDKSLLAGTVDFIYDGTQWHLIGNYIDTNTTYSAATTSASGLMSATDKSKLNGIATGATAVSESTVSGWGFTKNTGTYSKPSTGIPKTDLASAVQTSLGKADTALQSFTETDPTVPSWAKAATKPSYTVEELGLLPQEIAITAGTGFIVGESFSYKCNNLAWISIMIKPTTTLTGGQIYICATVDSNTIKRGNSPVVLNAIQDESFNRINAYFSQWSTQEIKLMPENNVPADSWIFVSGVYRFY